MSLITELLDRVTPSVNPDTLKTYSPSAVLSTLSGFLATARSYLDNSAVICSAFTQIFQLLSDYVSDDVLQPSFSATDHITSHLAPDNNFTSFWDCLVELATRLETTMSIDGDDYDIIQFVAHSRRFIIAYFENDNAFKWWDASNEVWHTFVSITQTLGHPPMANFNNVAYDDTGRMFSIWDLISDLSENAELNSALSDLASGLITMDQDPSGVLNLCATWINSAYESVRALSQRVKTAWATGGLYGVAMIIISFFKSGSSAGVNASGELVFTDNSQLVPAVYTSGIANFIATTFTSLATAVAFAFSRILGAVTSVISTLVTTLIQKLTWDYTQDTNASLVDSLRTGYACAPYGFMACSYSIVSSRLKEAMKFCKDNGIWSIFVPGGCIIYTNVNDTFRAEFHPDLIDRRGYVDTLVNNPGGGTSVTAETTVIIKPTSVLLAEVNAYSAPTSSFQNDNTGVLSNSDDPVVRDIIRCNMILYYIYCMSFDRQTAVTIHMDLALTYRRVKLDDGAWYDFDDNTTYNDISMYRGVNDFMEEIRNHLGVEVSLARNKDWTGLATWASDVSENPEQFPTYAVTTTCGDRVIRWSYYPGPSLFWNSSNVNYFGSAYQLPYNQVWAVKTPKYDKSTFIRSVVGACLLTAATVAIATVLTIGIRNFIASKRAIAASKVEQAWYDLTENPTQANATAYVKAVRKNNFFATIFGGTKFSLSNYWGETSDNKIITAVGAKVSGIMSGDTALSEQSYVSASKSASDSSDIESKINVLLPAWYSE